jgi:hypothetical protein
LSLQELAEFPLVLLVLDLFQMEERRQLELLVLGLFQMEERCQLD